MPSPDAWCALRCCRALWSSAHLVLYALEAVEHDCPVPSGHIVNARLSDGHGSGHGCYNAARRSNMRPTISYSAGRAPSHFMRRTSRDAAIAKSEKAGRSLAETRLSLSHGFLPQNETRAQRCSGAGHGPLHGVLSNGEILLSNLILMCSHFGLHCAGRWEIGLDE